MLATANNNIRGESPLALDVEFFASTRTHAETSTEKEAKGIAKEREFLKRQNYSDAKWWFPVVCQGLCVGRGWDSKGIA